MNKGGFSFKTFIGVTRIKRVVSHTVGIPLTKSGIERRIGSAVLCLFLHKH